MIKKIQIIGRKFVYDFVPNAFFELDYANLKHIGTHCRGGCQYLSDVDSDTGRLCWRGSNSTRQSPNRKAIDPGLRGARVEGCRRAAQYQLNLSQA